MTTRTLMIGITGSVYDHYGNRLGSAGAGKDTVTEMITKNIITQTTVRSLAFADPVKRAAQMIDPWIPWVDHEGTMRVSRLSEIVDTMGWDKAKRKYSEIRRLLQRIGTDAGWQLHESPNLWIDRVDAQITEIVRNASATNADIDTVVIILSDLRFSHEAEYVRGEHGQIIDVMRVLPTAKDAEKYFTENPLNKAASETEVLASDYTIVNDGDRQTLENRVEHYLKHNHFGKALTTKN